ncbi:MAG: hypothetical protein WKF79_09625 [Nocardioides sp.]
MPPKVALARTVVLVLVAWLVIRAIITLVASDAIIDSFVDAKLEGSGVDDNGAFRDQYADGAPALGPIAVVSAILFGGLLAFAAVSFAKRAQWARIVAIVFAVLSVLGGLLGLVQADIPFWYTATGFVNAALGIAVLVLLFSKDASGWFSRKVA